MLVPGRAVVGAARRRLGRLDWAATKVPDGPVLGDTVCVLSLHASRPAELTGDERVLEAESLKLVVCSLAGVESVINNGVFLAVRSDLSRGARGDRLGTAQPFEFLLCGVQVLNTLLGLGTGSDEYRLGILRLWFDDSYRSGGGRV